MIVVIWACNIVAAALAGYFAGRVTGNRDAYTAGRMQGRAEHAAASKDVPFTMATDEQGGTE